MPSPVRSCLTQLSQVPLGTKENLRDDVGVRREASSRNGREINLDRQHLSYIMKAWTKKANRMVVAA